MSRTSSSRVSVDGLAVMLLGERARLRPRPRRRRPCRRARTRPGSDGPTRAGARCTRAGCSPSSRNRCSPSSSARTRCGPRFTASIAGLASVFGVDIPLVGEERLDDDVRAVAMRHGVDMRLDLLDQALRLQLARRCVLRAAKRSRPCNSRSSSQLRLGSTPCDEVGIAAARASPPVEDVDLRQVVALADLEVVEVVRRRDLHRAGALLGVGIFVGDDRDAAADQRQDRRACRRGAL